MNHPAGPTFAQRMRQERVLAGLSQVGLAERISQKVGHKVYGSSIANIESGDRGVRLVEAVAVAEIFGIGIGDLLREREAIDDEIDELRRELSKAEFDSAQAEDVFQRAQDTVVGIRRRIAELEKTRRG